MGSEDLSSFQELRPFLSEAPRGPEAGGWSDRVPVRGEQCLAKMVGGGAKDNEGGGDQLNRQLVQRFRAVFLRRNPTLPTGPPSGESKLFKFLTIFCFNTGGGHILLAHIFCQHALLHENILSKTVVGTGKWMP